MGASRNPLPLGRGGCQKCFSKTAVSKLKEADYFNENNSLENFQSEIREWIDELIDEQAGE